MEHGDSVPNKIVLIGFMGTGKSTVAALLAQRLGWTCTDTDGEVVAEEGCSIAEIFSRSGEPSFRAAESRVLARLLASQEPLVIATGGGAVLAEANRRLMLREPMWLLSTLPKRSFWSELSRTTDDLCWRRSRGASAAAAASPERSL